MKMFKSQAKYLFGIIAIMYPLFVFCALVIFKLPIRYLSIGIIVFAIAYSVINSQHYKGKRTIVLFISPLILCAIGAVSLFLDDSPVVIEMYPALADLSYLTIMITSFFFPPPLAFYFIDIFDKSIKTKIPKEIFDRYCIRASVVWCVYFIVDAIIAMITVYLGSELFWCIYNGGITYVIMGLIFAGEFIILKAIVKKSCLEKAGGEITGEGSDVNS